MNNRRKLQKIVEHMEEEGYDDEDIERAIDEFWDDQITKQQDRLLEEHYGPF